MTGSYCVGSGTLWKNAVGVNLQIIAFCFIYLLHSILTFLGYNWLNQKSDNQHQCMMQIFFHSFILALI